MKPRRLSLIIALLLASMPATCFVPVWPQTGMSGGFTGIGADNPLGIADLSDGDMFYYELGQFRRLPASSGVPGAVMGLNDHSMPAWGGAGPDTPFFTATDLPPLFNSTVGVSTLTFSLRDFAAHKFYGNNTGSTGTPSACSIGMSDLPSYVVGTVSNCAPLFSSAILNQMLIFTPTNAAANTVLGNFTGVSAVPTYGTVTIAAGGTGQTTKSTAFDALSPMSQLGDTLYGNSSGTGTALPGNSTSTKMFLRSTGTGSAPTAPAWDTLASSDIPAVNLSASGPGGVTGITPISRGGTGQTTASAAFDVLSPITATGDLIIGTGTNSAGRLGIGTNGKVLTSNGTTASWQSVSVSSGVSSISTDTTLNASAPTGAVTLSLASPVAIANGGTGQTTASNAFNALSPVTSTGDLIIGNGTNSSTRLGIGTTGKILTSNGTTASWQSPSTSGSVTSAAMTGDGTVYDSTVTGSPITSTGTFAPSLATHSAGTIFGNATGSTAAPTFFSPGSADQVLGVAHTGGGLEYKTLTAGSNVTITPSAGALTISASGGGGGGGSLPNYTAILSNPVALSAGNTDVLSLNLTAGTWLILAQEAILNDNNGATSYETWLWDDDTSTLLSTGWQSVVGNFVTCFAMHAIVTLTGSDTIKLKAVDDHNDSHVQSATFNTLGNTTMLSAIKIQ